MINIAMRQRLVVAATALLLLTPVLGAGAYVVQKHRWAQARLAELEPRYARLKGLQQQQPEIAATLEQARALRSQLVYPASADANQTGNLAQQQVRDLFTTAGLQILSSQVMPAKERNGFDSIPLLVRVEGEWSAVQAALAVLGGQKPVILINDLDIQLPTTLANMVHAKIQPRLSVTFNLAVLRERA
ncbi:type II secretion system protein GspM [Melaminivora suipulveris]|nr:type II secretion system protein GspM [Melaminivora suipulveris]